MTSLRFLWFRSCALATCALALVSCSSSKDFEGVPPPVRLVVVGETTEAEPTTYCYTEGDARGCSDGVVEFSRPSLVIPQGRTDVMPEWDWPSLDAKVSVCEEEGTKCPLGAVVAMSEDAELVVEPGLYRVTLNVEWEGGDAVYEWLIQAG